MKKLLVVLFASMLVLSMAVVSMAAMTIKGDFRYEVISDSTKTGDEEISDNPDFRLIFDGPVSDTLSVHLQMRTAGIIKQQELTENTWDDTNSVNVATKYKFGSFYADEYWFLFTKSWGTMKVGSWDWKDTPSRILVKSNGNNIVPRNEVQVAVDVPFESGLYTGILYNLDQSSDLKVGDGSYALKVGFKTDLFGVEVNTEDYGLANGSSVLAYDLFYNINSDMKVYLYARDPKTDASDGADAENILGFLWKNIAGSKVQASLEYGIDAQGTAPNEWNQIGLQVKVPFKNGLGLEFEHTNSFSAGEEQTKDVLRFVAKY